MQGRLGYESKWKWAAEVAAVIPEATAAFERQFGKRSEVRHDQLRAVRPWDLVVYIFEPGTTESFGVQLAIDETLSREARERLVGKGQVRNVSVRYEREMPYPWFPPCQWDPSGFLHNFPDLENMSIQFLLNNSHMDSHREANMSPKEFVDSLVGMFSFVVPQLPQKRVFVFFFSFFLPASFTFLHRGREGRGADALT